LVFSILRYADELRDPKPYFEDIRVEPKPEAVGLAKELIEAESGRFEPEMMPDTYTDTLRELLRAKVEERAPQIQVAPEGKAPKEVINIMAALKESMQAKGRAKVRDAVRRRMGKPVKEAKAKRLPTATKLSPDGALKAVPRASFCPLQQGRATTQQKPRPRGNRDRGNERNG
jgi:non-homologous end joining protein Ku